MTRIFENVSRTRVMCLSWTRFLSFSNPRQSSSGENLQIQHNELALIKACLVNDDGFERVFREWESVAKIQALNFGALRILPFLQKRLLDLNVESLIGPELRRIHRYFWSKRQLQELTIQESVMPLMKGIESVSLKGFALERLAYRQGELRPFSDLDLLVSRSDLRLIDDRVGNYGLKYQGPNPARSFEYLQHAKPYKGKHLDLDIHWTFFPLGIDPGYDERIRQRASMYQGRTGWLLPSPTDALIHTVLHGSKPDVVSPIRWLIDAHLLVSRNEIDWKLLQEESKNLGLQVELEAGLAVLGEFTKKDFSFLSPRVRSAPKLHLAHMAARWSVKSSSLWVKRLARVFGSDLIMVRNALAKDGRRFGLIRVTLSAISESVREIVSILSANSISDVLTGKWATRESRSD